MKEVKNLIISAPNHATGYRLSDGFYIEWFSGSKSEGWSLISSSHHDIGSVDTSKPVIEIEKPRTKTEFVKVEFDSAWEAIKSYEVNDDLYYCASSTPTYEKMKAGNMKNLIDYSMPIKLYRKVETEIDDRQEFIDTYASLRHEFHGQRTYDDFSGFMFDSGRFKLVE